VENNHRNDQSDWGGAGWLLLVLGLGLVWWWSQERSEPSTVNYNESYAATPLTDMNTIDPTNVNGPEPSASRPVSEPSHNYEFRENGLYGYFSAVSDEDRAKGRATGDVILYAYRGVRNGVHRLTSFDDSGRRRGDWECDSPCVVIRQVAGRQVIGRLPYSPTSVIGGAFQDALAGRLEVVPERPPPQRAAPPREPEVELPHPGQPVDAPQVDDERPAEEGDEE
jgi:hypothetical protein